MNVSLRATLMFTGLAAPMVDAAIQEAAWRARGGSLSGSLLHFLDVGRRRWLAVLGTQIVLGCNVILWSLLFVVPGVRRFLSYSVAVPIVVVEGQPWGMPALRESSHRMRGRLAQAFLGYVSVIVVTILSAASFEAVVAFFGAAAGIDTPQFERVLVVLSSLFVGTMLPVATGSVTAALYRTTLPAGPSDGRPAPHHLQPDE